VCVLQREATLAGVTFSDALRTRITAEKVKPLAKPIPRKRAKNLDCDVPKCDPALMLQIAKIGSNLNQIAHACNSELVTGGIINSIHILAELNQIRSHLAAIKDFHQA
jgi:hypothetical protein